MVRVWIALAFGGFRCLALRAGGSGACLQLMRSNDLGFRAMLLFR